MRAQSATSTAFRPVSTPSAPDTKALPAARKNEPAAARRPVDSFESAPSKARPALTLVPPADPQAIRSTSAQGLLNPKEIPAADWTCFVHLNADNNLERFGKDDLNEMEAVGSLEGKLNMIALVDGGTQKDGDGWNTGARLMYVTKDPNNSSKIVSREIAVDPKSDLGKLMAQGKGELDTGTLAETTVEKGAKDGDSRYGAATGLSIYAPKGMVEREYQQPGSSWLSSRWNNVIATYDNARA
ncbi:hypothetical protein [Archangium sp.]|uniref:hypothetical protein n=1 Tax=Archangium sp. TaxID=1872627 RepID=UPI00286CB921|nr:hypothetical protein [Archangium sp.]